MSSRCLLAVVGVLFASGCGSPPEWEITVENTGTAPCSVYATLGYSGGGAEGTSKAEIEGIKPGEKLTLLVGNSPLVTLKFSALE